VLAGIVGRALGSTSLEEKVGIHTQQLQGHTLDSSALEGDGTILGTHLQSTYAKLHRIWAEPIRIHSPEGCPRRTSRDGARVGSRFQFWFGIWSVVLMSQAHSAEFV
jgi:hypothetical protein